MAMKNFGQFSLICFALFVATIPPQADAAAEWFWNLFRRLPGSYENPDTNRNLYELIQSRGFDYEQHYVTTEDGYILQLVRVVNPFVGAADRKRLKPVLLHHGFQCSGTLWLIANNGTLDSYGNYVEYPEEEEIQSQSNPPLPAINGSHQVANTLGFVLATRGYDVWLANYRGSVYSRNHTHLKVDSEEYWQFSMDEMIHYDLPAQIDYIRDQTDSCSIGYIGHSQGSLMMLALLSVNDDYVPLIKPFIAMSPVFYNLEIPSALSYFIPLQRILKYYKTLVPFSDETRLGIANLCQNRFTRKLCFMLSYPFFGTQVQNMIRERIPAYLSAVPMGSSSWNAAHIFQMMSNPNGQPEYFDLGKWENLQRYNQIHPPVYDASKINSTNICLIYTGQDWLNHIKSVDLLKSKLKVKLFDDYQVPDQTYNHMDMIWAKNVGQLVNQHVLDLLSVF